MHTSPGLHVGACELGCVHSLSSFLTLGGASAAADGAGAQLWSLKVRAGLYEARLRWHSRMQGWSCPQI